MAYISGMLYNHIRQATPSVIVSESGICSWAFPYYSFFQAIRNKPHCIPL